MDRSCPLFGYYFAPVWGTIAPMARPRKAAVFLRSDFHREFESISLQRGVVAEGARSSAFDPFPTFGLACIGEKARQAAKADFRHELEADSRVKPVVVATQCLTVALRIAISRVHTGAAAAWFPKPFQRDNGEALLVRLNLASTSTHSCLAGRTEKS
jgi:hypothetical protein